MRRRAWAFSFSGWVYFRVDSVDSSTHRLVFNRTVTLRDTWAKIEKTQKKSGMQGKKEKKVHETGCNMQDAR